MLVRTLFTKIDMYIPNNTWGRTVEGKWFPIETEEDYKEAIEDNCEIFKRVKMTFNNSNSLMKESDFPFKKINVIIFHISKISCIFVL